MYSFATFATIMHQFGNRPNVTPPWSVTAQKHCRKNIACTTSRSSTYDTPGSSTINHPNSTRVICRRVSTVRITNLDEDGGCARNGDDVENIGPSVLQREPSTATLQCHGMLSYHIHLWRYS